MAAAWKSARAHLEACKAEARLNGAPLAAPGKGRFLRVSAKAEGQDGPPVTLIGKQAAVLRAVLAPQSRPWTNFLASFTSRPIGI